jgi:hypothetical protein
MVGRPLRHGEGWWRRWLLGRLMEHAVRGGHRAYRSGRNLSLFLAALGTILGAAWMEAARRGGSRLRSVHLHAMRVIAGPFEGPLREVWRLLTAVGHGLFPHLSVTGTIPTIVSDDTVRRDMSDDEVGTGQLAEATAGIRTNLTPIIEAIREAGTLGGGDTPHALTVAKWHLELQELYEALAERVGPDADLAAETLPVSGGAHEITSAFAPAANEMAASVQEATEGWMSANGTRLARLVNDEHNKEAWDHSTRPD